MKNSVRKGLAPICVAVVLSVASCGSQSAEPAGGQTDQTAGQQSVQPPADSGDEPVGENSGADSSGQAAGGDVAEESLEGALVTSFPADVPLYDAQVVSSVAGIGAATGAGEWNAHLVTPDALEDVDTSIRQAYSEAGWSISSDMEFAGGYQLIARSSKYTVSITYNDFGSPEVTINYGVSAHS